ncbi:MAG: hypothetical protein CSB44_06745 [Gammaproteobacteria bacterium]|nr:MAG: hypothetical protein CSB44_06745 [Gammaproteobacteria bacterium]
MDASDNAPKPGILDALPARFATFDYEGHRWFGDESGGFTLRYGNRRKHRLAEVYVYPVAEQNAKLDHQSLVLGSTRASIEAISQAAGSGHYANFNLVNAAMRSHGVRTEARVQATYLQQNLATYTLVYQTEHEGTLLKVRVTMPDNDANRDNDEWDAFASYMFDRIIGELDADETIVSWLDE